LIILVCFETIEACIYPRRKSETKLSRSRHQGKPTKLTNYSEVIDLEPIVSVVIPTRNRPELVQRAVKSALAQTLTQIEVIVVIDGPDGVTDVALKQIDDTRLKVIELPTNQGSCAARTAGVNAASTEWIALFDDDDEWMPQKLELQLQAAQQSQYEYPIISCYLIARAPQGESIWPRRLPQQSEAISEYLFVRNTLFQGEGIVQTSTVLTPKKLLQKIPFNAAQHHDWDWLLQVTRQEGVGIEFVPQTLAIWYIGEKRSSVSRNRTWQTSLNWIKEKLDLVTPRAYSSFVLAEVGARASYAGDWKAFFPLLMDAVQFGKPRLKDIVLYFGMWFISPDTRVKLRGLLTRKAGALST
jgi:glycosyltransferase involved in cell wall biosynthesis